MRAQFTLAACCARFATRRVAPYFALGLVLGSGSAAQALAASSARHPDSPGQLAQGICPSRDLHAWRSAAPGARRVLVPQGATQVVLCRYSGANVSRAFSLVARGVVGAPLEVRALAIELDALPPSTGGSACPNDTGQRIIAVFRYRGRVDDPVTIALAGCPTATNGHVARRIEGDDLLDQTKLLSDPSAVAHTGELAASISQAGGDPLALGHNVGGVLEVYVAHQLLLRQRVPGGSTFRIGLLPGHYQVAAANSLGCKPQGVDVRAGHTRKVRVAYGCDEY